MDPGSEIYADDFLYDLEKDPSENINLIDDPESFGIKKMLRIKLIEHMVYAGEKKPKIID